MEHPPVPGVTSDAPLTQAGMLRRAWADIAATVAPQLTDLPVLLDARLTDLESAASLDEPSLLAVAEDASQYALEQGAGEVARTLSKRLRRSIYEFLLALDAVNPAEMANAPAIPRATSPFAPPPAPAAPPAPVIPVVPASEPEAEADARPTLSIAPADVSGADDAPTAGVAPTVPLWEQVAPPEPSAREVYRVASRTIEETDVDAGVPLDVPMADLFAADAAEIAELAAELAPVEEGGTALWEPEADGAAVAEVADDVVADEGTVFEPAAGEVHVLEADAGEAEAFVAEAPDEVVAEDTAEFVAEAPPEFAAEDTAEFAAEAPAEFVAEDTAELTAEAPVEFAAEDTTELAAEAPLEFAPEDPPEFATEAPVEFISEAPAEPVAEATVAEQPAAAHLPNGAKPHRDLLRVPRQFRRLPPMAPQAAEPTAPAAEAFEDDDTFGVPALPWPAGAPQPQPQAEVPAAPVDPEPEELGVPFSPLPEPTPTAAAPTPAGPAQPQPVVALDPFAPVLPPMVPPGATAPVEPVALPDLPTPPEGTAGAQPWTAMPAAPQAAPFPIAPREGFHLTDPGALDMALAATDAVSPAPVDNPFTTGLPQAAVPSAAPAAPAPAPAAAQPAASPPGAEQDDDSGTWKIRQSPRAQLLAERMAQKRREEAARAAYEAASVLDERHGRKRRRGEEPVTDLPSARRQLDENLRKKRGAEAAALLQRLAQEVGGRDIADLALDAGDRCRALGQGRSATNCYLAAWRSDPLYETPLWRLSDVCLNEQEIELAVGYLERIAELMRSRGDDEGAIGVYRKIAMIAPERQDVRDVIRLAKTTGRLDV